MRWFSGFLVGLVLAFGLVAGCGSDPSELATLAGAGDAGAVDSLPVDGGGGAVPVYEFAPDAERTRYSVTANARATSLAASAEQVVFEQYVNVPPGCRVVLAKLGSWAANALLRARVSVDGSPVVTLTNGQASATYPPDPLFNSTNYVWVLADNLAGGSTIYKKITLSIYNQHTAAITPAVTDSFYMELWTERP